MTDPQIQFLHAAAASQGRRARQEDSCAIWQPPAGSSSDDRTSALVVLADGMGGHTSGQVASRAVCDNYVRSFAQRSGDVGARLAHALADTNNALNKLVVEDARLSGMGSTIVAAHVVDSTLRWVSVGDSTLLLYRDGVLQRLNADHSHGAILDQQAAAGIISEEIARNDTRRRALHSALTGDPIPLQDLELQGFELHAGDWVVIASDGLLTLAGDEIATLIHDHGGSRPAELAHALVAAVDAKQEPNQDNTTVVAVRVTDPQMRESLRETASEVARAAGVALDGRTVTHVARRSVRDGTSPAAGAGAAVAPAAATPRQGGTLLGVLLGLAVVAVVAVLAIVYLLPLLTV